MKTKDSIKAIEIIENYKDKSNKDLIFVMDFIKKDFDLTKESVLKLTNHLDKLEKTYDIILKEYNARTKNV